MIGSSVAGRVEAADVTAGEGAGCDAEHGDDTGAPGSSSTLPEKPVRRCPCLFLPHIGDVVEVEEVEPHQDEDDAADPVEPPRRL